MDKEHIKNRIGDYLQNRGNDPRKPFRCANPSHPDSHPSMRLDEKRGKAHCFSCGADYDIFDLIGIDCGLSDAKSIFAEAERLYGGPTAATAGESKKKTANAASELTDFFLKAENDLKRSPEAEAYLENRGVSMETAFRCRLGFCAEWRSPKALREGKNPRVSARIIIPTGDASYLARDIDPNGDRRYRAVKEGPSMIFNASALYGSEPVFLVEGEFDALCILSEGRQAAALGGLGNLRKFEEMCANNPPSAALILSLDNDDAGHRAQARLSEYLKKQNILFKGYNLSGDYKDPNEHLQLSPDSFRAALSAAAAPSVRTETRETPEIQNIEPAEAKYSSIKASAVLDRLLAEIERGEENRPVSTGFRALDTALGGGLSPSLVIVGAISSLGKTAYVMQIADQAARLGSDAMVFTVEMPAVELIARSVSRLTQESALSAPGRAAAHAITSKGLMTGEWQTRRSGPEKAVIRDAVQRYRAEYAPKLLFIEENSDDRMTCGRIRDEIQRHIQLTGRRPLVIVDYIQLLEADDPRASDKQNMDRTVKQLKQISRDFRIALFAVSSLNRQNYNAPVNMEAFKESGSLEYSADVLIGMQLRGVGMSGFNINAAKAAEPREIEAVILKNRSGAAGITLSYRYYAKYNLFVEEESGATAGIRKR